jgi:hypothetical protein
MKKVSKNGPMYERMIYLFSVRINLLKTKSMKNEFTHLDIHFIFIYRFQNILNELEFAIPTPRTRCRDDVSNPDM